MCNLFYKQNKQRFAVKVKDIKPNVEQTDDDNPLKTGINYLNILLHFF